MRKTWVAAVIVIGSLSILAWTSPSPRSERRSIRRAGRVENLPTPISPEAMHGLVDKADAEGNWPHDKTSTVPPAEEENVSWVEEMVGSGLWTPDRLGRLRSLLFRAEDVHERYAVLWAIQCAPEFVPVEEWIEAYLESEADPVDKAEALESLVHRSSADAQIVVVRALSSLHDEVRASAERVLTLRRS